MHMWSELCAMWSRCVFGEHYNKLTPKVRALRLLEEVLELAQTEDVSMKEIQIIADQVYKKPWGTPEKELGGVLITVSMYAYARQFDMQKVFMDEFGRIMSPEVMARVRTRNLSGDKIGLKHVTIK